MRVLRVPTDSIASCVLQVETTSEAAQLRSYLEAHEAKTGSTVAGKILADWPNSLGTFVKVMPTDYKRVLEQMEAEAAAAEPASATG